LLHWPLNIGQSRSGHEAGASSLRVGLYHFDTEAIGLQGEPFYLLADAVHSQFLQMYMVQGEGVNRARVL
jgi:hypothetical protein